MKVWVTKYALSKGILEREGDVLPNDPSVFKPTNGFYIGYPLKNEWWLTKEEAVNHADYLRRKK